jgi:hypothetical protein
LSQEFPTGTPGKIVSIKEFIDVKAFEGVVAATKRQQGRSTLARPFVP